MEEIVGGKYHLYSRPYMDSDGILVTRIISLAPNFRSFSLKIQVNWNNEDGRDYSTGVLFDAICRQGDSASLRSGELRVITFGQIVEHRLPTGEVIHGLIIDRAINNRGDGPLG